MPAQTNAQRQARRLALLNEAATAAGWTGWRQYETAVITGRAKMNPNNSLLDCIAHGTSHSDFLASFGGDVAAAVNHLRDFYTEQLKQSGADVPTNADMRVMVRDAKRALEKINA